jgi:hypothetical protein
MLDVKKSNYGNYPNGNYGAHCIRLDVGSLALWFSYDTVVAFHEDGHCRRVCKNLWGPTTGKHLNAIDDRDHKNRLPREQFESELQAVLVVHGLSV